MFCISRFCIGHNSFHHFIYWVNDASLLCMAWKSESSIHRHHDFKDLASSVPALLIFKKNNSCRSATKLLVKINARVATEKFHIIPQGQLPLTAPSDAAVSLHRNARTRSWLWRAWEDSGRGEDACKAFAGMQLAVWRGDTFLAALSLWAASPQDLRGDILI